MRKLYLTLIITLIAALGYVSFSHANEVRSLQPNSPVKFEPTKWLEDLKFEKNGFKVTYSVTETSKGVFELTGECTLGCSGKLRPKTIKPKIYDNYPSIKEAAENQLSALFEVKSNDEDKDALNAKKKEDKELREKIKMCELDKDGKEFEKLDDKLKCAEFRIDALLNSRDPKDKELAEKIWDKLIRPQFTKDLISGKDAKNSRSIRLVSEYVSLSNTDGSTLTDTKINWAVSTQAHGYVEALKDVGAKTQSDINAIKLDIANGNTAGFQQKMQALEKRKIQYQAMTTLTTKAIGELNKRVEQGKFAKDTYVRVHSEDAQIFGLSQSIAASQSKLSNGILSLKAEMSKKASNTRSTPKTQSDFDFDFSLGSINNTAAQSAAGNISRNPGRTTGTMSNVGDDYFERIYGKIRGEVNDDFRGANLGGNTAPSVNLNQNQLLQNNNLNRNGNNFTNRGQGLRNRPLAGG